MYSDQVRFSRSKATYTISIYKYVICEHKGGQIWWKINYPNHSQNRYKTEVEAAKAVDVILIKLGKEPLNILKRKI